MDLSKLYKMQEELDNHIWEKHGTLDKMSKEELLDNTILALLVEVGELANTTRCFKHWSTKGMMDKDIILDELADVLHFYLSIGNQIEFRKTRIGIEELIDTRDLIATFNRDLIATFKWIYYWTSIFQDGVEGELGHITTKLIINYLEMGNWIVLLWKALGFTNEEVEQAYIKKHEENYRRQEEGY